MGWQGWAFASNYSALMQPLPPNIHLLTLLQLNSTTQAYLIRLVNIYEAGDDPVYSQTTTIALGEYVKFGRIVGMDERTLSAVGLRFGFDFYYAKFHLCFLSTGA